MIFIKIGKLNYLLGVTLLPRANLYIRTETTNELPVTTIKNFSPISFSASLNAFTKGATFHTRDKEAVPQLTLIRTILGIYLNLY